MNTTEIVRLSKWFHYYERGEFVALLNTLTLGVIFLPLGKWKEISSFLSTPRSLQAFSDSFGRELLNTLVKEEMIVSENFDDISYLKRRRNSLLRSISIELLYLLVTDNCNLRCRYCFEETPKIMTHFRPTQMSSQIALKALEMFAKLSRKYGNPKKKKIIHLYGGEPLLNKPIVREIIAYVAELKREKLLPTRCDVAIVTNGVLLDDSMAELFARYNVTVGLSLDGPQKITNAYRVGKKLSLDVYAAVIRAYELLKKYNVNTGLSVTLTPEMVESPDETLSFFLDELGIKDGISLNLLHYNKVVKPNKTYYESATDYQIRAFKQFRDWGIYEERIMRKARAFVDRKIMYADCGVVGYQLVVAPDGRIGVCQDFIKPRTYFKDSVLNSQFDPVEDGLFDEWRRRSPLFMEQCYDCPAIGICGGGCPASAELKTGSRWNIDERICPHSRKVLEWLIWDAFDSI